VAVEAHGDDARRLRDQRQLEPAARAVVDGEPARLGRVAVDLNAALDRGEARGRIEPPEREAGDLEPALLEVRDRCADEQVRVGGDDVPRRERQAAISTDVLLPLRERPRHDRRRERDHVVDPAVPERGLPDAVPVALTVVQLRDGAVRCMVDPSVIAAEDARLVRSHEACDLVRCDDRGRRQGGEHDEREKARRGGEEHEQDHRNDDDRHRDVSPIG
jgi:hypothetical protein